MIDTADLFAGPGGWSQATAKLGIREVGFEWNAEAVATARAAGHHRVHADVTSIDPRRFAPRRGVIGSPPCQAFTTTGLGLGRAALPIYQLAMKHLAAGAGVEFVRAMVNEACHDPRAGLVIEPMHWVVQTRPEWVACEQVVAVQPLWDAMARELQGLGYYTATGILDAAFHGAPQNRRRAILLAHRDRPVSLPEPTREPRLMSSVFSHGWSLQSNSNSAAFGPDGQRLRTLRRPDQPSVTITGKPPRWMNPDGTRMRTLTVAESGILQTFPADYPWQGKVAEQRQQVGDAIPPALAEAILRQVI